jgi:hypothetical protein
MRELTVGTVTRFCLQTYGLPCIFVVSLSLCAIAVDRHVLVHYPHARLLTRQRLKGEYSCTHRHLYFVVLIACIWSFAMLWPLPYAFNMDVEPMAGSCGEFCVEAWVSTRTMCSSARTHRQRTISLRCAQSFHCALLLYNSSYRL